MPQRHNALKKLRQDKKKYLNNLKTKNQVKKIIKQLKKLMGEKKLDEAKKLFPKVSSFLDKAAKKHVIKQNTARRKISRLHKALNKT